MRYLSKETRQFNRKKKLEKTLGKWHLWFAWYPVTIDDERVWLEKVQRRMNLDWIWFDRYWGRKWNYKLKSEYT